MRFVHYLEEMASKGEAVNLVFEERLFNLVGILQKITDLLTAANIPHEVISGLAVLIHVEEADPTHSMLTRDVDILIRRSDLEGVIATAESQGFRFRHAAGLDMLLYGGRAANSVHLLFSGENSRGTNRGSGWTCFRFPQAGPRIKDEAVVCAYIQIGRRVLGSIS